MTKRCIRERGPSHRSGTSAISALHHFGTGYCTGATSDASNWCSSDLLVHPAQSGYLINPLEKLGWMVGDNLEWDVAAPQKLGIFAVWIDVKGKGPPASMDIRPNRTLRTLSELMK